MEVAVQLDKVVIMLGLVGRVKVVLAAKVGKGALLSESDCFALDGDGQGCGGGLFWVDFVVGEFICTEFARGQVKFEDLGKCCNQVSLVL